MTKTWSTPAGKERKRTVPCAICRGNSAANSENEPFSPHFSCEGFSYVRCRRCGLVQMNPQPERAEVVRRYQEGSGEDYLSYELKNETVFLRLQELALKDAGLEELEQDLRTRSAAQPRVLDVGCATGALLEKLRDRGWAVTGVEISPAAEYARKKRSLDVRSIPLEENRFPHAGFDMVLASHLIEHLNDPVSFAREVFRILAPGGYCIVTTPNIDGFQAQLFRSHWRSAIFDHLYLFSIKTLSRLLTDQGFVIEWVCTWGGLAAGSVPAPLKRIADKAAKCFGFGDVMLIRGRRPPMDPH